MTTPYIFSDTFRDTIQGMRGLRRRATSEVFIAAISLYQHFQHYLNLFNGTPVQYLVISESPPGFLAGTGEGDFFYKEKNENGVPCKPKISNASPVNRFVDIGKVLPYEESFEDYLRFLASNGFILIDMLFLPVVFKTRDRINLFPQLIKLYFPHFVEILQRLDLGHVRRAALTVTTFAQTFRRLWGSPEGEDLRAQCTPVIRGILDLAVRTPELARGQPITFEGYID